MKRIGELLAGFFDEETLKKAEGYNGLFSSWRDIAGESVASHSRIVELDRSVLLVEADHPGWIQILQTRQKSLLFAVRRRFPKLTVTAIAFRLSRNGGVPETAGLSSIGDALGIADGIAAASRPAVNAAPPPPAGTHPPAGGSPAPSPGDVERVAREAAGDPYAGITDEAFRETLKRLEQTLTGSKRRRAGRP
jgi:hypothetical protein